jgi:hypothetical protein
MFMEYVNIFGLKLAFFEDWLKKNSESGDVKVSEKSITIKQHAAIVNYYLKIGVEYLVSLERGKPDDILYHNILIIIEKIALNCEKEKYSDVLKQYKINSDEFITKLKSCKNKSAKNLNEFLMDQFHIFSKHFGACEEKIKFIK